MFTRIRMSVNQASLELRKIVVSTSSTWRFQLGDKWNVQSEKQQIFILIATNPTRDNELNLRTANECWKKLMFLS